MKKNSPHVEIFSQRISQWEREKTSSHILSIRFVDMKGGKRKSQGTETSINPSDLEDELYQAFHAIQKEMTTQMIMKRNIPKHLSHSLSSVVAKTDVSRIPVFIKKLGWRLHIKKCIRFRGAISIFFFRR